MKSCLLGDGLRAAGLSRAGGLSLARSVFPTFRTGPAGQCDVGRGVRAQSLREVNVGQDDCGGRLRRPDRDRRALNALHALTGKPGQPCEDGPDVGLELQCLPGGRDRGRVEHGS